MAKGGFPFNFKKMSKDKSMESKKDVKGSRKG